jgi:anti-sigma-K factor RskA
MTCTDITPLLDDYINGTLPAEAIPDVERHLDGCDRCRAEVTALRALVADARALPRVVLPERELWTGIEPRLAPAPLRAGAAEPRGQRYRPLVLLAAALFLLIAGATLATVYQRSRTTAGFAAEQQRYTEATADLARKLANDPGHLSSATRAVVERNLAIVDQAIREAETALATDPGNAALEQMVLARYAQRLALLKRATEAGGRES